LPLLPLRMSTRESLPRFQRVVHFDAGIATHPEAWALHVVYASSLIAMTNFG